MGSVLLLLSHLVRVAIACTSDPIQFEKELERWVSAPLQVLALVTISICAGRGSAGSVTRRLSSLLQHLRRAIVTAEAVPAGAVEVRRALNR